MDPIFVSLGTVIAVAFTLIIFSYPLYKENPVYRFAEYTSVAAALGHATVIGLRYLYTTNVTPAFKGNFLYIVTLVFSLLLFSMYVKGQGHLARIPMSVVVGVGSGVGLRTVAETEFVKQIWGSMLPLTTGSTTTVDNLITVVFIVFVISYFLMTRRYEGPLAWIPKIARYCMMVQFGATLGARVATFLIWSSGRILFVLQSLGLA